MRSYPFVQLTWALFSVLVNTSKFPPDFLTVDIFEEQPIGTHVTDIAQELSLSVDTSGTARVASNFKIVVANPAINEYFDISSTNGRIFLKKHLDRDTLCQNERLCCDLEGDRASNPIPMPDGSYFRRTAKICKLSFRVVYRLNENVSAMHENRMAFCSVDVTIHDINDCAPRFLLKDNHLTYNGYYRTQSKSVSITIPENTEIHTCFDLPLAFDEDSGQFGVQEYRLDGSEKIEQAIDENIHETFAIKLGNCDDEPKMMYKEADEIEIADLKPKLQLRQKLDRETTAEYHLHLIVNDGGNLGSLTSLEGKHISHLPHSASLSITVIVSDVNDHAPQVEASIEVSLKEDTPVGSRVTQIVAQDKDIGVNAKMSFELRPLGTSKLSRFPFAIDSTTGIISIANPLDADTLPQESNGMMEFLVISSDNGQDISFSSTTTVSVHIKNVNDEAPVIKTVDLGSRSNPPRPTVRENLPPGTLVAFVTVTDADSGVNGMVTCRVDNPKFGLEPIGNKNSRDNELQLITKTMLDRELASVQPVTIICVDHAHPVVLAKTGLQRILVSVTDENDNDPIFANDVIEISVYENNPPGELLYRLNATDADEVVAWSSSLKTPLIYELDRTGQSLLSLDPSSGSLYTKESFDREKEETVEFVVVARDHGTPQRSASAKFVVHILDKNDHAPEFYQKEFNVSVPESISVGEVILKVSAYDKDQGPNSMFSYHLEDLRGSAQKYFELDPLLGNLSIKTALDRELESNYSFQIYSVDKGTPRQTAYCRVNIQVLDVNDNPPKFVYPTQMNHTIHFSSWLSPGTPLLKLTAADKDTGVNAEKIFLIADGNEKGIFQLDLQTGDLSLKPGLDPNQAAGRYDLKLEVRDDGSPSLSGFTYITVILDTSRTPPSTPISPSGKTSIERNPSSKTKDNFKSDKGAGNGLLPYIDLRGRQAEKHQSWEEGEDRFFGGEYTLILIICLSAIATMLILVLFVILAWMRRRSLLAAGRRGNQRVMTPGIGSAQKQFKAMFVKSAPGVTNLASQSGWVNEKADDMSTTATVAKRGSPVYWLKTTASSKSALDGRNIHLRALKSHDSDFSENIITPTLFRDAQQVNNCFYSTSPARKMVYHSPTKGPAPVIACDSRNDTYLSIPSTSFSDSSTKYIVDFPIRSVYQSLLRPEFVSDQEALSHPVPINPNAYRGVCSSLPRVATKESNEGKQGILQKDSDFYCESHQLLGMRLKQGKPHDCDSSDGEAGDCGGVFPRPAKKSVEFVQGGEEECLLVLPSDEEFHVRKEEDEHEDQSQLQKTGIFCHLPSSFV